MIYNIPLGIYIEHIRNFPWKYFLMDNNDENSDDADYDDDDSDEDDVDDHQGDIDDD